MIFLYILATFGLLVLLASFAIVVKIGRDAVITLLEVAGDLMTPSRPRETNYSFYQNLNAERRGDMDKSPSLDDETSTTKKDI